MDRFDILEAMGGIRDEYIEDAAVLPNQAIQMEDENGRIPFSQEKEITLAGSLKETDCRQSGKEISAGKEQETPGENDRERKPGLTKIFRLHRWAATAAALLCVCVIAFTIRSSQSGRASDSGRNETGMLTMAQEEVTVESEIRTDDAESNVSADESSADYEGGSSFAAGSVEAAGSADPDSAVKQDAGEAAAEMYVDRPEGEDVSPAAAMTDAGVTGPLKQIAEEKVRAFENALAEETGYSSLRFTHEITTDSEDWFSLKMKAYTCAADGFEQVTHFNINRDSSEYVTLDTLFSEDTDYITPLSEEVIRQMRERMASEPDAEFWLDSEEGPEYDFTEISPEQDFYFDSDGNLVLCFNEGEAAPLYMGTVEFTIPRDLTDKLFKDSI